MQGVSGGHACFTRTTRARYSQACFTQGAPMPDAANLPRKVAFNTFCFQWAYWTTLVSAAWGWRYMPAGVIRSSLIAIPVLLAILNMANAYWIYESCDEFIRLKILQCVV